MNKAVIAVGLHANGIVEYAYTDKSRETDTLESVSIAKDGSYMGFTSEKYYVRLVAPIRILAGKEVDWYIQSSAESENNE